MAQKLTNAAQRRSIASNAMVCRTALPEQILLHRQLVASYTSATWCAVLAAKLYSNSAAVDNTERNVTYQQSGMQPGAQD